MKCEYRYESQAMRHLDCQARAVRLVVSQEPDQKAATARLACWAHIGAATCENGASIVLPVTRS